MTEITNEIVAKFEEQGEKAIEFIKSIPDEMLDTQLYEDGAQWSIRQTLVHLVESEGSIPRLLQNILAGGEGVPEDFDLDRYNSSQVKRLGELGKDEIIAKLTELRAETIEMVKGFNVDDLHVRGRHPFSGDSNIHDMLRIMLVNSNSHLRDIRKAFE